MINKFDMQVIDPSLHPSMRNIIETQLSVFVNKIIVYFAKVLPY